MPFLTRRRFIAISAAAAATRPSRAAPARRWTGIALGARASIVLAHPDAARIVEASLDEIGRLENVFSLYRADSALSLLNRDGRLGAPPFELVDCLGIAAAVHGATDGAFDPTVQPLWAAYAGAYAAGAPPSEAELFKARQLVGLRQVDVAPNEIAFLRPGMALTLNGIAQGYVADSVARLLEDRGLDDILVDTGELVALGGRPEGGAWPVQLAGGGRIALRDRALATSSPLGTVFDAAGAVGHILDPRTGAPALPDDRGVSVTAPTAALADALSTALCLLDEEDATRALAAFSGCRRILP